jgi:hypothetical protein
MYRGVTSERAPVSSAGTCSSRRGYREEPELPFR